MLYIIYWNDSFLFLVYGEKTKMKKKVRGKKKKVGLAVTSGTQGVVLTAEVHLLRQRSILYLVDKSMTIREVARHLKTTQASIKSFFEDDDYVEELNLRIERVHGIDSGFRTDQAKITLSNLYEELRRREVEDELKDVSTRDLHRMITETQKELRLDTPGAFTSKIGVTDLGNLQDRYKNSLSGKLHKVKKVTKKKKKIKNVTPKRSFDEEADGDNQTRSSGFG